MAFVWCFFALFGCSLLPPVFACSFGSSRLCLVHGPTVGRAAKLWPVVGRRWLTLYEYLQSIHALFLSLIFNAVFGCLAGVSPELSHSA